MPQCPDPCRDGRQPDPSQRSVGGMREVSGSGGARRYSNERKMMESPILQGLNPAQRAAVEAYDEPSLIIAGAGSGKTRVLTSRIAYMIECGVKPENILALTFTNKAADQMRERIRGMVPGGRSRSIFMGTFHSIFLRILRAEADRIGFPANFTVYDTSDAKNLLKMLVKELNLPDDRYKPASMLSRISLYKNGLITPGAYLASSVHATEDRKAQIPEFGNLYNLYCQRCKHNGAMDFDDLLLQTNILLRDCPDVLARYQEQFKYILVDEYQDTNYAQYIIIRRLSQLHGKVCVVGDDAQSIYSFRGAKIENILSFQRDYPDAKVFKLEQNYRSTRTIVDAANSVIEHNARRMKKSCFSEGAEGEKIKVLKAYTDREEAELVTQDLRERIRESGDRWNEAAVLYRTNSQSQAIEESMRRKGIPYRIYKGSSFYDHKEIKDLLAYIRLIVNPRDDEAFRRVVNYPSRGIGEQTVQRISDLAAARGISMWEAVVALVQEPPADAVQRTLVRKVSEFVSLIRELSLGRAQKGLYEFGEEVARRSGILALYRRENTPESASALDNIEELLNSMQLFKEQRDAEIRNGEEQAEASIEEWLQSVMLTTDMDRREEQGDDDKVTLMTVHSAKGLEFKYVYIVGMEENLFPSQRAAETPEGLEEERRLFYVALTRAKCRAVLSYAEMRFKWGNMEFSHPSCFLREIDPKYLEPDADTGDTSPRGTAAAGGRTAIEELRRRFDVRYQQRGAAPSGGVSGFTRSASSFGARRDGSFSGGSARFGASRPAGAGTNPSTSRPVVPRPVQPASLRRLAPGAASVPGNGAGSSGYASGDRVEHATFGRGTIVRVETLTTDDKLIVSFDNCGEKTLLAKFAKLKKL